MHLSLPRTISCMDHAREAALSLEFNPDVMAIASKIIKHISGVGGTRSFNGIHFRYQGSKSNNSISIWLDTHYFIRDMAVKHDIIPSI